MSRTKKVKASGKFGSGYGTKVRVKFVDVESKQRKKQKCHFCNGANVKRMVAGIWKCKKCGKTFAGKAYYLDHKTKTI